LPEELAIIANLKQDYEFDVIAFDDLRVIKSEDNSRWREGEMSSYYHVVGSSLKALTERFRETHDFKIVDSPEGIGLLTPLQCR